jgi:hypothetical protein
MSDDYDLNLILVRESQLLLVYDMESTWNPDTYRLLRDLNFPLNCNHHDESFFITVFFSVIVLLVWVPSLSW